MTDLIKASRMALEALEKSRIRIVEQGGSGWKLEAQRCVNAITALRQALANQALDRIAENARELGLDYEPDYKTLWQQMCERCDDLDKKLAELEQQPADPIVGTKTWFEDGKIVQQELKYSEVYKQPAAWVGLTNVEIGTIAYNINPLDGITDFVRAIEAELRSKNT